MQEQQKQLAERLKQAQNILVTVSKNPSVDQLAAAIGLTLTLNHLNKHATAVFSGEVPSTIEFLRPEETLEKNTDSLRDFIIALDKSKADKLRYKVEDQVVRIFITPYRTSITQDDLDFSQGDFNVDVVVALGVHEQQQLDDAITAHGRILHDATVATINTEPNGELGTINWLDAGASSLSELVVNLVDALDKNVLDTQISTALLTGIVSATERFSNDKTSPKTMSASAELMAAGANQQLIATQLSTPGAPVQGQANDSGDQSASENHTDSPPADPGTLEIEHQSQTDDHEETQETETDPWAEPEKPAEPEPPKPQVQVSDDGQLITEKHGSDEPELLPEIGRVRGVGAGGEVTESEQNTEEQSQPDSDADQDSHGRISEPPERGGELTANSSFDDADPASEELTLPPVQTPVMQHDDQSFAPLPELPARPAATPSAPLPSFEPEVISPTPTPPPIGAITPDETLAEIEQAIDSPHIDTAPGSHPQAAADVDQARNAVEAAFQGGAAAMTNPLQALNAQPLGEVLHGGPSEPSGALPVSPFAGQTSPTAPEAPANAGFSEPTPGNSPADQTLDMPLPPGPFGNQPAPGGNPFAPPAQNGFPSSSPQSAPSVFPGMPPAQSSGGSQLPPPVPPPMFPPVQ
jgi:nanoRNase/pAp phosphatase (c-di-AMP/oligoRNAs hydrolase)